MAQNWLRAYELTAGPAGGTGFKISQLKMSFSLSKTEDETCNNITIQIWNLNEQHKAILDKKDCVVSLKAGYEGNLKQVFTGYVVFCTGSNDGADYMTELTVVDGRVECRDTQVSFTFDGSNSSEYIFDRLATKMKLPLKYGDDVQHFNVDNYSFVGDATVALDELCESGGLSWSIQDGELQIKKKFGTINATAYKLSSDTGLIGCPKKIRLSSENSVDNDQYGYEVTFFMNADIKISDFVYLDSKKVKGFFRVSEISMSGSNLDGDWTCSATLLENSTFVSANTKSKTTQDNGDIPESEFLNSSMLVNKYGTYENYVADKPQDSYSKSPVEGKVSPQEFYNSRRLSNSYNSYDDYLAGNKITTHVSSSGRSHSSSSGKF